MTLIKCFDCKEKVSDRAIACPKCGFPVSEELANMTLKERTKKYLNENLIKLNEIDEALKNDPEILLIINRKQEEQKRRDEKFKQQMHTS